MQPLVLTEIAEDWFRRLNNIQQHQLKVVVLQGVEGDSWLEVPERAIRGTHYVHLQMHVVSYLKGGGYSGAHY